MQTEEFLKKVRERAGLPNNDAARDATEAVFETLRSRISHEGGDNIAAQLPKDLKELWESGLLEHIQHKLVGFERLDLGAFLAKIAEELDLENIRRAETVTQAVFFTLQEQISPGASASVEHQLPDDLRGFWISSRETMEGPPYEMEAPVMMTEEEEGARSWGPETDLPSGADVETTIAHTEASMRDKEIQSVPRQEHEAEPPAMERVTIASAPGEHNDAEGPGSTEHYRSDAQLTSEIEDMLMSSDEIDAEHINVFVQAGNVTLRGKVSSPDERSAAIRVASEALGVGEIRSELDVVE